MTQSQVFLFVLLSSPLLAVGQFVLPFLYMPLKSLFPSYLGLDPKHFKVTSEHVRIENGWTVQQTYGVTTNNLQRTAGFLVVDLDFSASNLTDLDYYWSYTIPFHEADPSLSNVQFVARKTAGYVQEQLLKIVSQKFSFQLNTVASVLSIQEADLWTSYNPANWKILVHAMINESLTSFTKRLDLPSVRSLADLVGTSSAELRNANLSRFEALVFPFIPKKAILDTKTTMFLINSSGITPGKSYMDIAIRDILEKHENITLTSGEFGILYNLTIGQSKAFMKATFSQIFHLCGVSFESINNLTLPEVSHRVVGSVHSTPPCPLLISIKAKIIRSFGAAINPQTTTVLEILSTVSNLTWREVRQAENASLPDWEFLDSVTLSQLADISGHSVESLLNNTASEAVQLVFRTQTNGNLTSRLEAYRLLIRSLLVEKFNLSLIEVANLTKTQDASMLNYSSPLLFSRFLNATMTYFRLNFSDIVSSVQVSEAELFNLPRQKWMSVISAIFNAVLKAEASDLEMSTGDLLQLLGIATVEPSISKLKELINNQILAFKEKTRRLFAFRNSPLADLAASKGLTLSSLNNDSVFDVIVTVLSVSVENASFVFNWTEQKRTKLQMFTLKEVASYRNITLENLGSYRLLELVEYLFLMHVTSSLPPIMSSTSLPPCKQGFRRVDDACIDDDECRSVDRCSDDSLCQNYLGGFDCECKDPGYFKVNIAATCKPCKTFSGTLIIPDRELNAVLSNRSTEDFYLMKKSFETTVNDELRKSPVGQFFFGSRLKDFRSGSIIVDFYIFMSRDFSGKIQDLQNALIDRINNSKLGPFTVTASEVAVEDFDECKAHDDNCGQHATCVNNVGLFECKCKDGFEGDGISCEDDAFALKKNVMKPYPQTGLTQDKRVYNYRLSRARRIVENLFGIIASRWRVFRSVFLLPPDTVELVVFTSLCLHNYLRQSPSCTTYCPVGLVDSEQNGEVIPGSWRQESAAEAFSPLAVPSTGHNATTDAKGMRKTFKDYFFDEGSVDWQWDMC